MTAFWPSRIQFFSALVGFQTLLVFLSGCGGRPISWLSEGGSTPTELQKRDFSQRQNAEDLRSDPLGEGRDFLKSLQSCDSKNGKTQTSRHVAGFLGAHDTHLRDLKLLSGAPTKLPSFPSPDEYKRALFEFRESARKVTPRETIAGLTATSALVQKYIGRKRALSQAELSAPLKKFKNPEVKITEGSARWFYAFSLEPDNEFQWLVQCKQLDLTLPDGTETFHLWPSFAALEQSSLSPKGTTLVSLRSDLQLELGSGFSFRTPETTSARIDKAPGRLKYLLQWEKEGLRQTGMYFREAENLYFSRFFSVFRFPKYDEANTQGNTLPVTSKNEIESSAVSFQLTGSKAFFESQLSQKGDFGGLNRYRNLTCDRANSTDDKAFQTGGMHHFDKNTIQSALDQLPGNAETLPLKEGQKLCQVLYALD